MKLWKEYEKNGNRTLVNIGVDPSILLFVVFTQRQMQGKVSNILDIGCGEGTLFWYYRFFNNKILYTGMDISAISLKNRILSLIVPNYKIICADGQRKFPFGNNEFDILIARMVLHNFSNLETHFEESARVLKDGQYYIASTLTEEYIEDKLGRKLEEGESFDYPLGKAGKSFKYHFQKRNTIIGLAKKYGLEEQDGNFFRLGEQGRGNLNPVLESYPRAQKIEPFDIYVFRKQK